MSLMSISSPRSWASSPRGVGQVGEGFKFGSLSLGSPLSATSTASSPRAHVQKVLRSICSTSTDETHPLDPIFSAMLLARIVTTLRLALSRPSQDDDSTVRRKKTSIVRELSAVERLVSDTTHGRGIARQFLDCGGIELVLELLTARPAEKPWLLRVILALAKLGREEKERLCDRETVTILVRAVEEAGTRDETTTTTTSPRRKKAALSDDEDTLITAVPGSAEEEACTHKKRRISSDDDVRSLCGEVLTELGYGNPVYAASVRHALLCLLASQVVATRLVAVRSMNQLISCDSSRYIPRHAETYPVEFLPSVMSLFEENAEANYDATALLRNVGVVESMRPIIAGGLVGVLNKRSPIVNSRAVGFCDAETGRPSSLATAKLSACHVLTEMLSNSTGASLQDETRVVALFGRKNVMRVLWRILTDRALTQRRERTLSSRADEELTSELLLRCATLVGAMFERAEEHQRSFVKKLLAGHHGLLSKLVCTPDAFRSLLLTQPRSLVDDLRARLRLLEQQEEHLEEVVVETKKAFFVTDLTNYDDGSSSEEEEDDVLVDLPREPMLLVVEPPAAPTSLRRRPRPEKLSRRLVQIRGQAGLLTRADDLTFEDGQPAASNGESWRDRARQSTALFSPITRASSPPPRQRHPPPKKDEKRKKSTNRRRRSPRPSSLSSPVQPPNNTLAVFGPLRCLRAPEYDLVPP